MAPSQVLTDLDPEGTQETTIQVSPEMKNMNSVKTQDDKVIRCMSNCEDTTFNIDTLLDQQAKDLEETGDVNVDTDTAECVNSSDFRFVEGDDPDATEHSSSFSDTTSETEDCSRLSEAEVDSQFCGDNRAFSTIFDGFDGVFQTRNKKLTAHWRRYVRPLMWRCKWIELRIKEFQCQALKYDKELAAYEQSKKIELGHFGIEGSAARSLPFYRQSYRKKLMRRKKRKRLEDTVDIPSYMSSHSLFSYYENKRSDADAASLEDDCGNHVNAANHNTTGNDEFGVYNEWPSLEFRDDENTLEYILWKIEVMQSRIHDLTTRLQKVVQCKAERFSSIGNGDVATSSAPTPTISHGNGDTTPDGHNTRFSEYDTGVLVELVSEISSYGEATLPNIIESTVELLSATDVSMVQLQVGISCDDIMEDVLIENKAAQEELQNCASVYSVAIAKAEELAKEEEEEATSDPSVAEMEPHEAQEQLNLKFGLASELHVPKNKRKRGERKAGLGTWSSRSSG